MEIIQFKDRKKELAELKEIFDSKKFEFLVIYGRRRIGKTELVLHATKTKKRVYYLAVGEKNLDRFYAECVRFDSGVKNLRKDYEVLFNYLINRVDVIIIDEFQNLIKENKNILNLLQSLVDTSLKKSNLKLILLGSSVSLMTSKVMSYQSPLYGRRTGSLKLQPLSFFHLHEFFPKADSNQLMEIFGFAGGVPYYLNQINGEFWRWLQQDVSGHRSFLKDEVDFLLRYEFDDPSTYKLILEAIANGKTRIAEIKDYLSLKRTDIYPYLKNLIDVDLVKRVVPVTENIKSRSGRYYLKDNFLKFWFRFIYPNLSTVELGIFNVKALKSIYNSYLGGIFEDVATEYLIRKKLVAPTKIGRWWQKENEIDIVALDELKRETLFGECNWSSGIDAEEIVKKLQYKAMHVRWHNGSRKESYVIFAKSFQKTISHFQERAVRCITFDEMMIR